MTRKEMLKDLWKEMMKVRRKVRKRKDWDDWFISTVSINELKNEIQERRSLGCHLSISPYRGGFYKTTLTVVHLTTLSVGCNDSWFNIIPCLCYQEISPNNWVKGKHIPYKFDHEAARLASLYEDYDEAGKSRWVNHNHCKKLGE